MKNTIEKDKTKILSLRQAPNQFSVPKSTLGEPIKLTPIIGKFKQTFSEEYNKY